MIDTHLPYELDPPNILSESNNDNYKDADIIIANAKTMYCHMIKFKLQPENQSASWVSSIIDNSENISTKIKNSNVQKILNTNIYKEKINNAYNEGLIKAKDETFKDKNWLESHSTNIKKLSAEDLGDFDKTIKFLKDNYNSKGKDAKRVKDKIDKFINGED